MRTQLKKIHITLAIPVLFILGLMLTSCSTGMRREPPTTQPKPALQLTKIERLLSTKKQKAALAHLEKVIATHPGENVALEAAEILGEFYQKQQSCPKAIAYYKNILNAKPPAYNQMRARLNWAKCELQSKNYEEAKTLIEGGLKGTYYPDEELEAIQGLYTAYLGAGQRLNALRMLVLLSRKSPNTHEREAYRTRALDIVDSRLTDEELDTVASRSEFDFLRGAAYYRLGTQALDSANYPAAKSYLTSTRSYLKEGLIFDRATQLIEQIESRGSSDPRLVAAVLPLTGRNSKIGLKTLHGLQLGLGVFGPNKSNLKLSVVDSESSPDVARKNLRQLLINDRPVAIVGSLLSRTSQPVASLAQEFGVPAIGLSQKAGITDVGDFVFRNSFTTEMLVKKLVEYAMTQKNMNRFAILYPNDPYGAEYANLFWDEVLARGGQIVGAQTYDPKETDFRGPIQRLVGTYYVDDRASEYNLRLLAWKAKQKNITARDVPKDILPPIVDFDALFIPDSTRALAQIAPMLAYNDIDKVTLLGTNLWNTSTLIEKAGKYVESSIFVDSTFPVEGQDGLFLSQFQKTFGYFPENFEVQAYDTGFILRQLLESGADNRIELQRKLSSFSGFPGASGPLTMNASREIDRPLSVLTVTKGQIQRIQ